MRINTNISSLKTQEYLRQSQANMEKAMNRLSSGKRVNSASDDAAGLAIATRMRAKESALNVGSRNTQDAISLSQTAESALSSITNILTRMKDLATQAANDTNNTDDRSALDKEFSALKAEITHISSKTNFNGTNLLNAAGGTAISIQLSDASGDVLAISLGAIAASLGSLTLDASGISTGTAASTAIASLDAALTSVASKRAELGATINRLDYNVQNVNNQSIAMASAASQIQDADMAKEMSEMTKFKILADAGVSMLSQANQSTQAVSKLLQG